MRRAAVIAALLVPACASTESSLRTRFANERNCNESVVSVSARAGDQYYVSGCGQSAMYLCRGMSSDSSRCAEQTGGGRAPPEPTSLQPFQPGVPPFPH